MSVQNPVRGGFHPTDTWSGTFFVGSSHRQSTSSVVRLLNAHSVDRVEDWR